MPCVMRANHWLVLLSVAWMCSSCRKPQRQDAGPSPSVAPPPPSAESPILELNQTADFPLYRVKLVSQRDCSAANATTSRSGFRTWGVELEVTNLSPSPLAASPFYATLVDDQRFTYTTSLSECAPMLPAKLLQPRETVRGWVPFELPRDVVAVSLNYHPVLPGNASYVARFRLEL